MKKRICFLPICLLSILAVPSLAQWVQTAGPSGPLGCSIQDLAVSGTYLFAGTYGGAGVFRSTDNGTNWTLASTGLTNIYIRRLVVNGTNLYAATLGGVFRSTDNGTTWTAVGSGLTDVYSLIVDGTNIYAGTVGGGAFRSTNNGASWTSINTGLIPTFVNALAVSGTNLFAGIADVGSPGGNGGVFRSTNNGTSWIPTSLMNANINALTVFGANLFAGTNGGLFRSTDNGTTWTSVLASGVRCLIVNGRDLFAHSLSDVVRSTNNGTSWTAVNTGLTGNYSISLAVSGTTLFAAGDCIVWRRSLNDFMSIVNPPDGAGGITSQYAFKWNINTQALAYAFQVSTDQNFSSLVVNQYTTDTTYIVSGLLPATVYYWRVRAENSTWASDWGGGYFTTKITSTPQLSSPASGATLVSVTPTLSWTSVISTASYTLQLSTQPTFDVLVYSKDMTSTSVIPPQLQRATTYYWRVRAQTPGDTTVWSSIGSFTTVPNAPNRIILNYPDSTKQNAYQNDWLLWQGDATATSYLVQISQSPLFASIFDSSTVMSAGYRNPSKVFASGSTYFWRVKGSNVGGDGQFSSVWSFRVGSAVRVPATSYSSSILDHGRVKVGQFKDTVLTVSNIGTDTLRIQNISSNSSEFGVRPTSRIIALGQSFLDTIRFVPAAIGMRTSSVIVSSNSSTGSDTIKVSGFGYGQGVASINASSVLLGNVKVGQYKDTTITITNTGNDTLKIASITSSSSIFSVWTTNKAIPPGQSIVDTIRFTPTSIGTTNAAIAVSSNSPSSPDTVKISGFGYGEAAVSMSTSVISFGIIRVWQYKDTVVTILNQGNDTLKIQSVYVYGGMFSARPFSGFVPPGKSFNDTIRFSPSTYGNMQATFVLTSNSVSVGDTISLSGVGLAAALKFNVVRMDFGLVLLGKSKDTAVTVLNQGNDTLRISSITCKHPAVISTITSLMIPPGGFAIDTFRFVPQTVGPVLGTMLFVSNGLTTYDTLRVIGSGVTTTTGIAQEGIPSEFRLQQNYPNPFNPSTSISYSLPKASIVSLRIFNALGQEVVLLVSERKEAGYYQATWNASNAPSGIYFYRLRAGEFVETNKMILLR
ncbi:MAG: choice-of-anchor D domain-containing protein [Ignavibacteriales bacterium]|nr:choice-of-anchor D domain-containing protein [Ignavibacteriales bacterium]